jgi:aspartyl-tRNA(Asn)/glutamyl-tRNA(Gln) amidotransferase subunit B
MKTYETVIGLEVHAQLLTKTKMFCSCGVTFGDQPNTNICPRCSGQPGTLPTINKEAVAMAVKTGVALGCKIRNISTFARKNYFYPDLPKGYQISQFDLPLCEGGKLKIEYDGTENEIFIIRIHMEEDAGKLMHDWGNEDKSHVDFNRCGAPLIEIVSGPDMRSPEEGVAYLKTLRSILMYLEVCDGNMQEGSFRCDANLSVMKKGAKKLGTRTELKNLNSFRAIERALKFEQKRQIELLENGGKVIQETRLWNETDQKTESMRSKEEAHDYRYFPEPDLGPLEVTDEWINDIKSSLPELADERAKRFVGEYKIPEYDAKVLTTEKPLADYYEKTIKHYNEPKKISNWIMTELLRELKNSEADIKTCQIKPADLGDLVKLIDDGTISGKIAKDVFLDMYNTGATAAKIVKDKGLTQLSDTGEIEKIIDQVVSNNESNVKQYKEGKVQLFGFFVGQVMKLTKGKANPKVVNELLKKKLG